MDMTKEESAALALKLALEGAIAAKGGDPGVVMRLLKNESWLELVAAQLMELAIAEGSIFTLLLDRRPGVIARLIEEAGYEGYKNPEITDANYPVASGGLVPVRFRTVPGKQLKSPDEWVWRNNAEAAFHKMGLQFPDPAEALLVPAKNRQTGRGRPYVAFIQGASCAFYVSEGDRRRSLDLSGGNWYPEYEFVGVEKQK